MKQVSEIQALVKIRKTAKKNGTIGFVPTMGAFHEGHLSLMRKAATECDFVIVSLFVNPLQFGQQEDLSRYPRTLSEDCLKAASVGVDLLWTPSEAALYPAGFQTTIEVGEISRRWEGASRAGHFQGVATIVAKLLQLVSPDRLYLGQKDYQQVCVIRRMMADLHFETLVRVLPNIREKDGLAMSSRNRRLSPSERVLAPVLYRALQEALTMFQAGERNAGKILEVVKLILKANAGIAIEYIALCEPASLEPVEHLEKEGILLVAIKLGSVRLIDNVRLELKESPLKNQSKSNRQIDR